MAVEKVEAPYIILIDTDSYAGNFERDMCAYVTGAYGECDTGKEISDHFSKDIKFYKWYEKHLIYEEDAYCSRPVSIWRDNPFFDKDYTTVAIFCSAKPAEEMLKDILERAIYFGQNNKQIYEESHKQKAWQKNHDIKIFGVRLVKNEVIRTQKELLRLIYLNSIIQTIENS